MFQLVAISELHIQGLKQISFGYWEPENSCTQFIDSVGSVYRNKVQFLSDMIRSYNSGLKDAELMLMKLYDKGEFDNLKHVSIYHSNLRSFLPKLSALPLGFVLGLSFPVFIR